MNDVEGLIRSLARAFPDRPVASVEAWVDEEARFAFDVNRRRREERERAQRVFRQIREGQL